MATAAALAAAVLLTACGGEPAPKATPTPEATPTATVTPTPTPPPTPAPAALPAIETDTRWEDLFDGFTGPEQACIRSALGPELEAMLGRLVLTVVLTNEDTLGDEAALFSCLSPETARGVLVYSVVAGFEDTEGRPVSGAEVTCLHKRVADVDAAAVIAGTLDATAEEFVFRLLLGCLPDVLLTALLAEAGVTLEELAEREAACLRAWVGSAYWGLLDGLTGCVPDLVFNEVFNEDESSCLSEWLNGLDWAALMALFAVATEREVATTCRGPDVPGAPSYPDLLKDYESLLALQETLAGDGGGAEGLNWSAELAMTSWTGVTVGGSPQRVTTLRLANSGLTGQVSGLVGNLTGLTELRLNGNRLTGRLPSKLGQLTNLTHVYLAGNSFTGCVPPLLRTVTNNDVAGLGLSDCAEPIDISRDSPTLTAGTYKFIWNEGDPPLIFDVPADVTLQVKGVLLGSRAVNEQGELVSGGTGLWLIQVSGPSFLVLDVELGKEWSRHVVESSERGAGTQTVGDLFDRVVESAWVQKPIDIEYGYGDTREWDRPLAPGTYHFGDLFFDVRAGVPVMVTGGFIGHDEDYRETYGLVLQVVGGDSRLCIDLQRFRECGRTILVADGDAWSESAVGDTFDLISASIRRAGP